MFSTQRLLTSFVLLLAHCTLTYAPADKPEADWVQLFNGKDLTGWTPKIRGYAWVRTSGTLFELKTEC
jgi:hypothetical protein